MSPNKNRAVQVLTHEDGTVSIGISGKSGDPKTLAKAKKLEEQLNKQAGFKKYTVSGESMPTEKLETIRGGCEAGACAEPKAVAAAGRNTSPVNGSDTRWRGKSDNKYPYQGSNFNTTPVDDKQMEPCLTCADPKNAKEITDHGNGKSKI